MKIVSLLFLLLFVLHINSIAQDTILPDILPNETLEQSIAFDFITLKQSGVAGTGFYLRDEYIGKCAAIKNDGGPWPTIDGYKKTLCGNLTEKALPKHSGDDADGAEINYHDDSDFFGYIYPGYNFKYLIDSSAYPFNIPTTSSYDNLKNKRKNNLHFEINFNNSIAEDYITEETNNFPINNQTCVYGVWCEDEGHTGWPEIHPIQQMWQTHDDFHETVRYDLLFARDNSDRYDEDSDYESCDGEQVVLWVPEIEVNSFYIAFQVNGESDNFYNYTLLENSVDGMQNINMRGSLLNQLVYKNQVIATILLPNNHYKAEFVEVCKSIFPQNTIKGYIKITTHLPKTNPGAYSVCNLVLQKLRGRDTYKTDKKLVLKTCRITNITNSNNSVAERNHFFFFNRSEKANLFITDKYDSINTEIKLKKGLVQEVNKQLNFSHLKYISKYFIANLVYNNQVGNAASFSVQEDNRGLGFGNLVNNFDGNIVKKIIAITIVKEDSQRIETKMIYTIELMFSIVPQPYSDLDARPLPIFENRN